MNKNLKKYILELFNYHTHTIYCDGKNEPEEYVKEAIKQKFKYFGFSAHAPVPFDNKWSIKYDKIDEYCRKINFLKNKYFSQIEIFLGLEIDYIPGITTSIVDFKEKYNLDYAIGAIHLVKNPIKEELWFIDGPEEGYHEGLKNVFESDVKLGVYHYFNQLNDMIINQKPDIIGHIDKIKMNNKKIYFKETDNWFIKYIDESLDIICKTNCIVEVNTRGIYKGKSETFFPDVETLKKCKNLNIPVTISTDAHSVTEISNLFSFTSDVLKQIGFKFVMILTNNGWKEIDL